MSLIPSDLVTDLDLLALDSSVLEDFGKTSLKLAEKRNVAVIDWLRPRLEAAGLPAAKHLTKRKPVAAYGYTSGAYTDLVEALSDQTDTHLSSVLAGVGDGVYIGMTEPYRGLFVGMTDTPNINQASASLTYWNGAWTTPSSVADGTVAGSLTLGRAGRMVWGLPDDWIPRAVNGSALLYWMRLQVNSLHAATLIQQMLPMARSRLTNPTAQYALHLVYREGIGGDRGNWKEKAELFLAAAQQGLELVLPMVRDEFDITNDGVVDTLEVNSITQDPFTFERG